jgi:hypothetical protein
MKNSSNIISVFHFSKGLLNFNTNYVINNQIYKGLG